MVAGVLHLIIDAARPMHAYVVSAKPSKEGAFCCVCVCMRVCVSVDMCALMHTCVSIGPPECWCQTKANPGPPSLRTSRSIRLSHSILLFTGQIYHWNAQSLQRREKPTLSLGKSLELFECVRVCVRLCVKGLYNAKIDNGIRRRRTKRRTSLPRAGLVGSLVNTHRDTQQHTHKLWAGSHKFVQKKNKK